MTVHDGSKANEHGLHNLFIGYVASVSLSGTLRALQVEKKTG